LKNLNAALFILFCVFYLREIILPRLSSDGVAYYSRVSDFIKEFS